MITSIQPRTKYNTINDVRKEFRRLAKGIKIKFKVFDHLIVDEHILE